MLIVWFFFIAATAFIAGALVMGFAMRAAAGPQLERAIDRTRSGVAPGLYRFTEPEPMPSHGISGR